MACGQVDRPQGDPAGARRSRVIPQPAPFHSPKAFKTGVGWHLRRSVDTIWYLGVSTHGGNLGVQKRRYPKITQGANRARTRSTPEPSVAEPSMVVRLFTEGIGASLNSMRHIQRPSHDFDRARLRYAARFCNRCESAPSRICQPSGLAISQVATARVSNCSRESSTNAHETGAHFCLSCLTRSTEDSTEKAIRRG